MTPDRTSICVVAQWLGVRSQVWLWRQLLLMRAMKPSVIYWRYENIDDYPLVGFPLAHIEHVEEPNNTGRRWLWRLRNLHHINFYGSLAPESRELESRLRQWAPACVLAHFGHFGLRVLPITDRLRIPLVVHFHGDDISSSLNVKYYRWSLRRNLHKFTAIVCVTEKQRRTLLDLGAPKSSINVIPCGVPTDEFTVVERPPDRPVTFICVCRLVRWKGVHHIIESFARVASGLPASSLLIVGDGPEEQALQLLTAHHGLESRVRFVGSVPPSKVRELMADADVFIQHSLTHRGWNEGSSVAIAEASATGLPVVVSDSGGNAEQVLDGITGMVFSEHDVDSCAKAMMTLGRDPELRHRLGLAGRHRVEEHFNTHRQVAKLEAVLARAAGLHDLPSQTTSQ